LSVKIQGKFINMQSTQPLKSATFHLKYCKWHCVMKLSKKFYF